MIKVRDSMHLDPETILTFSSGFEGAYAAKSYTLDEGIYDSQTDSYDLLSEYSLTDLEDKHLGDEDSLAFVSLVVLSV